ncbi:MAG: right-handed parallel beta-helix repeat-containing protein [bacterium]
MNKTTYVYINMKIFLIFIFFPAVFSWSAKIVDNHGGDSADFNDIGLALTFLQAGDTLLVRGDTEIRRAYNTQSAQLSLINSGTESQPIVVAAWPNEKVEIRLPSGGLDFNGSYWILENLVFDAGSVQGSNLIFLERTAEHCVIRNCEVYHGTSSGRDGIDSRSDHLLIEKVKIHSLAPEGSGDHHGIVLVRGRNIIIRGCEIYDVHGDGIQLQGSRATLNEVLIENNHIYVTEDFNTRMENAIDVKECSSVVISNNRIHGFRRSYDSDGTAINVHFNASDISIEKNEFYDCQIAIRVNDGTYGVPERVKIHRNTIHDLLKTDDWDTEFLSGIGIKLDGARDVTITHNTISNVNHHIMITSDSSGGPAPWLYSQVGIVLAKPPPGWVDGGYWGNFAGVENMTIVNNLFHKCSNRTIPIEEGAWGKVLVENNGYFDISSECELTDTDMVVSGLDPDFLQNLTTPFSLNSSSPAINAGKDLGEPDMQGLPDLGAFEFGVPGFISSDVKWNKDTDIQIWPNPFKKHLNLSIENENEKMILVEIYDIQGRLVKSFPLKSIGYTLAWNGKNMIGKSVVKGSYYIRVKFNKQQLIRKIIRN